MMEESTKTAGLSSLEYMDPKPPNQQLRTLNGIDVGPLQMCDSWILVLFVRLLEVSSVCGCLTCPYCHTFLPIAVNSIQCF